MDYAQILPELFLGSCPRNADEIDRLRQEAGVTAVLNLQTDDDMLWLDLGWETLLARYEACGIEVRRVPVRDFDAAELSSKLPQCVRTLDGLLAAGHVVYLHCTAGVNRSPTVAMAFLHRCRGWKLDGASAHLAERCWCSPDMDAVMAADWGNADGETASACKPSEGS
jgi:protein-tyrosine phosphatase